MPRNTKNRKLLTVAWKEQQNRLGSDDKEIVRVISVRRGGRPVRGGAGG